MLELPWNLTTSNRLLTNEHDVYFNLMSGRILSWTKRFAVFTGHQTFRPQKTKKIKIKITFINLHRVWDIAQINSHVFRSTFFDRATRINYMLIWFYLPRPFCRLLVPDIARPVRRITKQIGRTSNHKSFFNECWVIVFLQLDASPPCTSLSSRMFTIITGCLLAGWC